MSAARGRGRLERWTYVGRRVDGGEVLYAWLDADHCLWRFPAGRALAIGARYDVAVVRGTDGTCRLGPEATFTGEVVEDASLLAEWTAHDRVAGGLDQLRRAEQRARKDATTRYGAVTLKQLRDLHAGLPARAQAVLLAQVFVFLTDA